MQISRLRLVNFRQHEHTELELGAGLTGIIGPNGVGKTTILEAIAWAMYGMPAARGSRETIRRRGAPPRAKVEVEMEFALGSHQYRILRSLNGAELYQDGDSAPVANSLASVTERVTRLLGMTRDEFFNTYFTGQKELAVMAAMSAPERAQFLSRVLGYERIRAAQDRLKEKRSALRARLDALRAALGDLAELDAEEARAADRIAAAERGETSAAERFAAAERCLAEVRPRWEQLQRLRESALTLEAELRVTDHQVRAAEERIGRLERQSTEAGTAAGRLEEVVRQLAPLAALREEVAVLDVQAEAFTRRRGVLAQLEEVRRHLGSVDERTGRLPTTTLLASARERVSDLRATLTALALDVETARTAWVRDAQDARTKRQGLLDQYQELKDQRQRLVQAGPEGNCPTCTRPLGAGYEKVLGLLDRQLEEVVTNGNYYKQRIEQLQDEPPTVVELERRRVVLDRDLSDATAELGRLEAGAQESGRLREEREHLLSRVRELESGLDAGPGAYDETRHVEVAALIERLQPAALEAERLKVVAGRTAALEAELAGVRREREEAAARAAELRERFGGLDYSEATYAEARAAESAADRNRRQSDVELIRARAERASAAEMVEAVTRRRAEREERERQAALTAGDLALHQELDRALTDLRTELNATLRPDLSELASGFLRDLTNGRYTDLELDEDYGTTLLDDGDPKAVISGGEEDVANLALRLAISQMIAERAGQPLSLLVLDEIFGSLDEDRRIAVVDLLRSLADRFPQVILITHVDSVREGFDRVIRVGVDPARGVATVRDEPLGGHDVAA
ncbi:MAG: SMC family ATPase [Gemmatimonadales bacterium]|nr:SMC family ATPase [Gemmatimonadales bacterium]MBA3553257.1 SMC family ATPase [Gemmatimonadales bacterium]